MPQGAPSTPRSLTRSLALIVAIPLLVLASACRDPWIRVQNVGDSPANVTVTYLDKDGNTVAQDSRQVAPGAAVNFSQGRTSQLPDGYRGSALVESDQPIVALRRTDMKGSTADMVDGDTISTMTGGSQLYLPLVMSHGGPWNSWNTRFNLQNLSESATCVTLTYISSDTGDVEAVDPPSRAAAPRECADGGRPLAPLATMFRDSDTFGVRSGFQGAVRIETSTSKLAKPGSAPAISATVDTWNATFNLLTSYHALDGSEMGTTVLLPLVEREVGPQSSYNTYFQIQSTVGSLPVNVQLHIEGVDASGTRVSKDNTLTLNGAMKCVQVANDSTNCLAAGDVLPSGFTGWARLVSARPIGVVVERGSYYYDFGSYRGIANSQAGRFVALPAVKRNSWLRILAADGGAANVRVRYVAPQLDGGEQSVVVGVNGLTTILLANEAALPDGFDGSAILEADRPIVAVVAFDAGAGGGDRGLLYDGVTVR